MNANDRALLVAITKGMRYLLVGVPDRTPERYKSIVRLDDALHGMATDTEFGEHSEDMAADRERDARSYDEVVQPE